MRAAIEEAGGREVVFLLHLGEDGVAESFRVVARGRLDQVPAPLAELERGDLIVHNHPSGLLEPSEADLRVAAELAGVGVGSGIVDNEVEGLYVIVEPTTIPPIRPIDVAALAATLEPGGALEAGMADYEARESQVEMLRAVARAFNDELPTLVEAGTGVGKSFAYLVPAFAWAGQNAERVVISTATINLQQQLVEKDVPAVRRLLGSPVEAALLKGRGNYLCRIRLDEALEEDALFQETDEELTAIRDWAGNSATGSRDDLSFMPSEDVWSRVNSDPDACAGSRCRKRDDCFLMRSRKLAARAGILIVNHHLLFSDLALRLGGFGFDATAILPPFKRVIFDEAHNIERSATSYFSESFSRFSVLKLTGRLLRTRRNRRLGLLLQLQRILDHPRMGELPDLIARAREYGEALNAAALAALGRESAARVVRRTPDDFEGGPPQAAGALVAMDEALTGRLADLEQCLLDISMALADVFRELSEEQLELPVVHELRPVVRRLEGVASLSAAFRAFSADRAGRPEEESDASKVYWLERATTSGGEPFVRFTVSPLEIGAVMREAVLEPFPTVVFTSATLTVGAGFAFFASRIGLDTEERAELALPSPFAFHERVLLAVPTDAPLPEAPSYRDFVARFLGDLVTLSEGRALLLFTSYEMLRVAFDEIRPRLAELGITVLRQGDDDRGRLLERFRTDAASVLFATDSFWEGVDTPGEALTVVGITRLPFRVPTHPIVVARMEAIRARGGNPFMELSLPEAVMRLKQGFGRLMRRGTDRGVVVITDGRILKKQYGSIFLASLPQTLTSYTDSTHLLDDIEGFLYS